MPRTYRVSIPRGAGRGPANRVAPTWREAVLSAKLPPARDMDSLAVYRDVCRAVRILREEHAAAVQVLVGRIAVLERRVEALTRGRARRGA
jgi:hypothetical protein